MLIIKNAYIKTMAGEDIENGSILVGDDGRIAAIGASVDVPADAEIIDAEGRLVTPGLIDAHAHLGLKEPNEKVDPLTPHMRSIDGLTPDENFIEAVKFGVTAAGVGPGSTNVIAGTASAIKLDGSMGEKMIIKYPVGMKCAFGDNPIGSHGESSKKAPITRMGVVAMMRDFLTKSAMYFADKEAGKTVYDAKLEAMLPVMRREIPLKIHAHKAVDILSAIRVAKEFDLPITIDHCTDGHLIAEEIAESGYPVIVGPSMTPKRKPELANKSLDTPAVLYKAGVELISITTDGPPATPVQYLALCAGLAASRGLPMDVAFKAITINPAKTLGIADRVGSLEVGKDADIVIWTANPITTIGACAVVAIINGKVIYRM